MKARFTALALILLAAWPAAAQDPANKAPNPTAAPPANVAYQLVEPNARIPLARYRIQGYEVGRDNSLIIRASGRRYYRVQLWEPCQGDLRFGTRIALETRPDDTLDRWSRIGVNGNWCSIRQIDQVARPTQPVPPVAVE